MGRDGTWIGKGSAMDQLASDIRHALRRLRGDSGFTAVALLTLVLGVGATSSIFTLVDHVLLRPLPLQDPGRLVAVWGVEAGSASDRSPSSWPDVKDFRAGATQGYDGIEAWRSLELTVSGPSPDAQRIDGATVTHGFFGLVGATTLLGRAFTEEDDRPGATPVVVVSEGLWRERWGGRADILGQPLSVEGRAHEVVGVLGGGVVFPRAARLFLPVGQQRNMEYRGVHGLAVLGRLKPGVSLTVAEAELQAVADRLKREYPEDNAGRSVRLEPLQSALVGDARPGLQLLLAAVVLLLLVTCANLAGLMLTRATRRVRELAVCASLGASRTRLVRQMLAEVAVLAVAGGLGGVFVAAQAVPLLLLLGPGVVPGAETIAVDGRVVFFSLAAAVLTAGLFGIAPALLASRVDPATLLREDGGRSAGSRSRQRLRRLLIAGQTAMAVVLVSGAGLLLQSLWRIGDVDPGFRHERLLTAEVPLIQSRYDTWGSANFADRLLPKLQALPGVEAAALAADHPFAEGWGARFNIEGRAPFPQGQEPEPAVRLVSAGYLQSSGIPLRRGRGLDARDRAGAPGAVMINEEMARRFFPGEDPLGRRLLRRWWDPKMPETWEIVGIVADVRTGNLGRPAQEAIYYPLAQVPTGSLTVLLRTQGESSPAAADIVNVVREIDPEVPVTNVAPMAELMAESLGERRLQAGLLAVFAFVALLLAALGLYGMLSFVVLQRQREIAVRVALGAGRADVTRLVGGEAAWVTGTGLLAGLLGALAAGRIFGALLFGVQATDPSTVLAVGTVVVAASVAATALPLRRALRVAPASALRSD